METTEKKVSHSLSPWHCTAEFAHREGEPSKFCWHSIRDKNGLIILSTFAPDSQAISEADGKIAAAAPELLAALRAFVDAFDRGCPDDWAVRDAAQNAIKKALE